MIEYELEAIVKLNKDLRIAASTLTDGEARYLVDTYYASQANRIRAAAQLKEAEDLGEPNAMLQWAFFNFDTIEKGVKGALHQYSKSRRVGEWLLSIHGIGPVISAGLIAHIDIKKAPTAGHIWRFAGLDASNVWLGKDKSEKLVNEVVGKPKRGVGVTAEQLDQCAMLVNRRPENLRRLAQEESGKITKKGLIKALAKRPWNADLKTLCWKTGQSFMKLRGNDKDIYGRVYEERKAMEVQRNESGGNAETARRQLAEKKFGQNETRAHLEAGHLSPGQIDARARRYAVKLFLSHLQHVMWEVDTGEPPPRPYVITHMEHAHYITPPNWPIKTTAAA